MKRKRLFVRLGLPAGSKPSQRSQELKGQGRSCPRPLFTGSEHHGNTQNMPGQGVYRPLTGVVLVPRGQRCLLAACAHGSFPLLMTESIHAHGMDLHDGCAVRVNSTGVPSKTLIVPGPEPCFERQALSIPGGTGKPHFL